MKYEPFSVFFSPGFWAEVHRLKLDVWRLDESPRPIRAQFQCNNHAQLNVLCPSEQDKRNNMTSLTSDADVVDSRGVEVLGLMKLWNKEASFPRDGGEAVERSLRELHEQMLDSKIIGLHLTVIAYGDLKHGKFIFYAAVWGLHRTRTAPKIQSKQKFPFTLQLEEIPSRRITSEGSAVLSLDDGSSPVRVLVVPDASSEPDRLSPWVRHQMALPRDYKLDGVLCYRGLLDKSIYLQLKSRTASGNAQTEEEAEGTEMDQDEDKDDLQWTICSATWRSLREVDLTSGTDRSSLVEQSNQLHLSLMKWRHFPNMQLDILKRQRVLILGCGTLGCNVARLLLGWGLRHMDVVDYGVVSLSNPVRQSLFAVADVGKPKAQAMATALKELCPSLTVEAHSLMIPMPGHHHDSTDSSLEDCISRLTTLVQNCDVVFLGTDSRESRWLPTLLATAMDKPCMNAALGFSTYVALRHSSQQGCYFCPDATVPINSMKDRTLDQQCTVTRPGVSYIASALVVELYVSYVLGRDMGEDQEANSCEETTTQIRGFVGDGFEQHVMRGSRSHRCFACGDAAQDKFRTEGSQWVKRVVVEPSLLDEVTGAQATAAAAQSLDLLDAEFEDFDMDNDVEDEDHDEA